MNLRNDAHSDVGQDNVIFSYWTCFTQKKNREG